MATRNPEQYQPPQTQDHFGDGTSVMDTALGPRINSLDELRRRQIPGVRTSSTPPTLPQGKPQR